MLKMKDYFCHDCGAYFEKLSRSDSDVRCPDCGSDKIEFRHSPQAIRATGNGVYSTKMRTK